MSRNESVEDQQHRELQGLVQDLQQRQLLGVVTLYRLDRSQAFRGSHGFRGGSTVTRIQRVGQSL